MRRQAGLKAGDRVEFKVSGGIINIIPKLPSADNEYTPQQRRVINARLAKALKETKAGKAHGPFSSVREMAAFLKQEAKKVATNAKRPRR